jgi:enoyl-CoA hydratase/carnithine racemase
MSGQAGAKGGQEALIVEDDAGVRCITLSRPEKLNAFTAAMFDGLTEILIDSEVNRDISCVVITGAGRAFSAGWDLSEMSNPPTHDDGHRHGPQPCIDELIRFPKPLITAVNGLAIGFGATTPLHSDVTIASSDARFRFPFAELGLAGESAATATLALRVGYQEAARLLLTCDWIDAEEAARIGLVWKVVPPRQLRFTALDLAHRIARNPYQSVTATKRLLLSSKIDGVRAAFAREMDNYAVLLGGPANREAIDAVWRQRQAGRS